MVGCFSVEFALGVGRSLGCAPHQGFQVTRSQLILRVIPANAGCANELRTGPDRDRYRGLAGR